MTSVLVDRLSLKVTGEARASLPFEIEVKNVPSLEGFTKELKYTEIEPVLDDGNKVYELAQPDKQVVKEVTTKKEVTEETADKVMITYIGKVPMLDESGKQKFYEETVLGEVTTQTDQPVMIVNEQGEEVQKQDKNGQPLYLGQVKTGNQILCFEMQEITEQKKDENGKLLYYKEVKDTVTETTPQEPLVIVENSEDYELLTDKEREELVPVTEVVEKSKTILYSEQPEDFTIQDILLHKYITLLNETQLDYLIAENFIDDTKIDYEYDNHSGNVGNNVISLPANGKVRTLAYPLSSPAKKFSLLELDADEGIEIRYGTRPITGDLLLTSNVEKINFIIVNKTDSVKDIRSFCIGY